MKKTYNKDKVFLLTSICVCLSFMAFVAVVFPALRYNNGVNEVEISGIFAVFGGMVDELNMIFSFNIFSLIGYLIPLGIVFLSVKAFNSKKSIVFFIISILSIISIVITLLEPILVGILNQLSDLTLSFGPIISTVLMVIVLISSLCSGLEKNKIK